MLLVPCGKCASTNTDMYRERQFSARGFPHDAVLHCRCCGHRLWGMDALQAVKVCERELSRRKAEEARLRAEKEKQARQERERLEAQREKKRARDRKYRQKRRAQERAAR